LDSFGKIKDFLILAKVSAKTSQSSSAINFREHANVDVRENSNNDNFVHIFWDLQERDLLCGRVHVLFSRRRPSRHQDTSTQFQAKKIKIVEDNPMKIPAEGFCGIFVPARPLLPFWVSCSGGPLHGEVLFLDTYINLLHVHCMSTEQ
jgi:hypothetical protein